PAAVAAIITTTPVVSPQCHGSRDNHPGFSTGVSSPGAKPQYVQNSRGLPGGTGVPQRGQVSPWWLSMEGRFFRFGVRVGAAERCRVCVIGSSAIARMRVSGALIGSISGSRGCPGTGAATAPFASFFFTDGLVTGDAGSCDNASTNSVQVENRSRGFLAR